MQALTYLLDFFLAAASIEVCFHVHARYNCALVSVLVHVGARLPTDGIPVERFCAAFYITVDFPPRPRPPPPAATQHVSVSPAIFTVDSMTAAACQHCVQQHEACPTESLHVADTHQPLRFYHPKQVTCLCVVSQVITLNTSIRTCHGLQ